MSWAQLPGIRTEGGRDGRAAAPRQQRPGQPLAGITGLGDLKYLETVGRPRGVSRLPGAAALQLASLRPTSPRIRKDSRLRRLEKTEEPGGWGRGRSRQVSALLRAATTLPGNAAGHTGSCRNLSSPTVLLPQKPALDTCSTLLATILGFLTSEQHLDPAFKTRPKTNPFLLSLVSPSGCCPGPWPTGGAWGLGSCKLWPFYSSLD